MALAFTGRFGTGDMIFGTDLCDLEIAVQDGQATLYAISGMNGGISRWQLPGNGGLPQLAGQQLHSQASLRTGSFELAETGGELRLVQEHSGGGLSYYALGSRQQDILAGADAGGLGDARLDSSAASDVLEGGAGAADLYGHVGDDVLVSGAQGGELTGGAGADIFVITPVSDTGAEAVTVRDFTPGEDVLDLSLFEGLYSPSQLQSRGRSFGIDLEAGGTRIAVVQAGGWSWRMCSARRCGFSSRSARDWATPCPAAATTAAVGMMFWRAPAAAMRFTDGRATTGWTARMAATRCWAAAAAM